MNSKMFIITHKDFEKPSLEGYYTLVVGAEDNPYRGGDYYDNTGINISDKNNHYCELTGLYWIWKNDVSDIVGLCHYRRYFTHSTLSNSPIHYLKCNELPDLMRDYDIVLPTTRYYKETTFEAVNVAPNHKDIREMRRALTIVQPNYVSSFESFLNGNEAYLYNMFVARRSILDEYCKWLFPILFFIENEYDISHEDAYRQRLFGFLSERLIYVWVNHNVEQRMIKHFRVVKTDEPNYRAVAYEVKNKCRNYYYHLTR